MNTGNLGAQSCSLGHFSVSAEQMELVAAEPSKQLGLEGGAGAEILQGRNGWSLGMSHGFSNSSLQRLSHVDLNLERCPVTSRHLGSGWE